MDPAAVQENRLLYGCGGWTQQPLKPDSQVVVDVFFARTSPSEQFSHPEEAHKRRILQNGGRIFYAFNFRGLRIQIAAGRIPMLSQGGTTCFYDVRNVRRFDWPVSVIYRKGTPFSPSDEALFEKLGGRITHRLHAINMLLGVLPDRSIPALRRQGRVEFVEASGGVYCLA